jgi:hypothetical protein
MRTWIALISVLALLFAGFEFVTDYNEVLEGTPLAALPDGHSGDDGHTPTEHGFSCDGCHFGGVHLAVMPVSLLSSFAPAAAGHSLWSPPAPSRLDFSPLDRPPIA